MEAGIGRRHVAFLLPAAFLATGCLDPRPGGSQPHALRAHSASSARPGCVEPAHLLVLDEDAIDESCRPGLFSGPDVNDDLASVGLRLPLRYFAARAGSEVVLPGGEVGDEGWFAPRSVRLAWKAAGPDSADGLRNYVEAGPGLGSPDAKGRPESLLEKVPDLVPLRATGLARLEGRSVCAVVLDNDARMSYSPLAASLKGPNLGKVAFQVLGLAPAAGRSPDRLPGVRVRILDADAVCEDVLLPFREAPVPRSSCEPRDTEIPACAREEVFIDEPWDAFDPAKWEGDGDGLVSGGMLLAREGVGSTFADWIRPCPVRLDSGSAVRFLNRVRFALPAENDFAESGALFFVNAGDPGSADNYVFLNLGYTVSPSKVFVEMFGRNGDMRFDQFTEASLAYAPSQTFPVDLWIERGSYRVAIGGEAVDTVALPNPLASISLFEVGVQQNPGGLRGMLDHTTIGAQCRSECKHRPRKRERCEPRTRCRSRAETGRKRHKDSDHAFCHHAKSRERNARSAAAAEKGSTLAKTSAWTRSAPNPCGKNALIRLAREKVRNDPRPPEGLLLLSRMIEEPGCPD